MATTLPYLYIVRLNVEDEAKEKIDNWSNRWHMPDLLEVGFWGSTRYRCVEGEPEYLHLYEISGTEFFDTEGYRYICRCDPPCGTVKCQNKADPANPTGPQMLRHMKDSSRMVYEQIVNYRTAEPRTHFPGRHGDPVGSVKSKTVWNVRMDVDPEVEEDFVKWYHEIHLEEIGAFPGFIAGRFVRRIDSFSTIDPKYLVLWEIESPDVLKNLTPLAQRNISEDEKRIRAGIKNRKDAISVRIWPE